MLKGKSGFPSNLTVIPALVPGADETRAGVLGLRANVRLGDELTDRFSSGISGCCRVYAMRCNNRVLASASGIAGRSRK